MVEQGRGAIITDSGGFCLLGAAHLRPLSLLARTYRADARATRCPTTASRSFGPPRLCASAVTPVPRPPAYAAHLPTREARAIIAAAWDCDCDVVRRVG